ncbi:hypothetical protein ES708_02351 [subsurface metagenome]
MNEQKLKNLEEIGSKIADALNATMLFLNNGFIVEKKNSTQNTYVRIHLIQNFVDNKTDISFERGSISDKKLYVKEIIKDITNLSLTIPKSEENVLKDVVTFLYTNNDRFSLVNVDTNMLISRICAFDKRKILEGKPVPKEISEQRRKFQTIF